MELWIFLGGGFVLLVILALRNGAFRPVTKGDRRGNDPAARAEGYLGGYHVGTGGPGGGIDAGGGGGPGS
jgi:hypothetical protein